MATFTANNVNCIQIKVTHLIQQFMSNTCPRSSTSHILQLFNQGIYRIRDATIYYFLMSGSHSCFESVKCKKNGRIWLPAEPRAPVYVCVIELCRSIHFYNSIWSICILLVPIQFLDRFNTTILILPLLYIKLITYSQLNHVIGTWPNVTEKVRNTHHSNLISLHFVFSNWRLDRKITYSCIKLYCCLFIGNSSLGGLTLKCNTLECW